MYNVLDYGVISDEKLLQTEAVQKVLDMCRENGGTVVFPAGTYVISSVRMWSDTTILLKSGATLLGSEECDDYEVYEIPEGVELRTDMELIPQQYNFKPWKEYRRAMISAFGVKNIAVIGEPGSVIDGRNCYDPNGEEGYRGPHGMFITNCENVVMRGYTIQHSGNFMHQLDKCDHVVMEDVTNLGASDGIHLHCCTDILINRCIFRTGDDCIAGINIRDMHVNNCVLNTSCNVFRIGGVNILVENCHVYGPGYYPHRMTIVKSRTEVLPREEGRHNLISLVNFFASETFPAEEHSHNIVFRNMIIENLRYLLEYHADDSKRLQNGDRLQELVLDNVLFKDLVKKCEVIAPADEPLHLKLRNVTVQFADGGTDTEFFFDGGTNVIVENF